jgi:AbrB family looped-hinge helix DNA binding protein
MAIRVTVDKAGRLVLPKPLRDTLRLTAGSSLELDTEGERIILTPVRPSPALRKEFGIWVFQGPPTEASIPELLNEVRERRLHELQS